jgi:predicted Zn-dependent protease with MMP-like domain
MPVVYRNWHPDASEGDEEAVELLGEYLSYEDDRLGEQNGPIVLYLGAIQLYCEEEGVSFNDEVRVTYLHELGHHFGWDEDELAKRGLA